MTRKGLQGGLSRVHGLERGPRGRRYGEVQGDPHGLWPRGRPWGASAASASTAPPQSSSAPQSRCVS